MMYSGTLTDGLHRVGMPGIRLSGVENVLLFSSQRVQLSMSRSSLATGLVSTWLSVPFFKE
jgi:hypothetical protein